MIGAEPVQQRILSNPVIFLLYVKKIKKSLIRQELKSHKSPRTHFYSLLESPLSYISLESNPIVGSTPSSDISLGSTRASADKIRTTSTCSYLLACRIASLCWAPGSTRSLANKIRTTSTCPYLLACRIVSLCWALGSTQSSLNNN